MVLKCKTRSFKDASLVRRVFNHSSDGYGMSLMLVKKSSLSPLPFYHPNGLSPGKCVRWLCRSQTAIFSADGIVIVTFILPKSHTFTCRAPAFEFSSVLWVNPSLCSHLRKSSYGSTASKCFFWERCCSCWASLSSVLKYTCYDTPLKQYGSGRKRAVTLFFRKISLFHLKINCPLFWYTKWLI